MLTILEMLIYKRPMTVCLKSFGILNCHVMMLKMLLQMLGIKCQLSKDVIGKVEQLVVQQFSKLCQLTGACVAHSIWKWLKKFSRNLDMLMSFKQDKRLTVKIGLYSTLSTVHRAPLYVILIMIMKKRNPQSDEHHASHGYGVKGNEVDQYYSESFPGFMSPSDDTPSGAWSRMCGFGEHCKYGFNLSGNRVIQLHYP